MNVSATPSAELAELNELLDGMKEEEMWIFESLLTCGCHRDGDEELSSNHDSTSPLSPSVDRSSPEEVIMNFCPEDEEVIMGKGLHSLNVGTHTYTLPHNKSILNSLLLK